MAKLCIDKDNPLPPNFLKLFPIFFLYLVTPILVWPKIISSVEYTFWNIRVLSVASKSKTMCETSPMIEHFGLRNVEEALGESAPQLGVFLSAVS